MILRRWNSPKITPICGEARGLCGRTKHYFDDNHQEWLNYQDYAKGKQERNNERFKDLGMMIPKKKGEAKGIKEEEEEEGHHQ